MNLGAVAVIRAAFGQGSGAIVLDNVNCQGDEESIDFCPSSVPNIDFHYEDVGVRCQLGESVSCTTLLPKVVLNAAEPPGLCCITHNLMHMPHMMF